jgi:hypothetical protein
MSRLLREAAPNSIQPLKDESRVIHTLLGFNELYHQLSQKIGHYLVQMAKRRSSIPSTCSAKVMCPPHFGERLRSFCLLRIFNKR